MLNSATILIREWFDSKNGNPYFSTRAWLRFDGDPNIYWVQIPFCYGRGSSMATQEIWAMLQRHDIVKSEFKDSVPQEGMPIIMDWVTVTRRRDLHMAGRGYPAFVVNPHQF